MPDKVHERVTQHVPTTDNLIFSSKYRYARYKVISVRHEIILDTAGWIYFWKTNSHITVMYKFVKSPYGAHQPSRRCDASICRISFFGLKYPNTVVFGSHWQRGKRVKVKRAVARDSRYVQRAAGSGGEMAWIELVGIFESQRGLTIALWTCRSGRVKPQMMQRISGGNRDKGNDWEVSSLLGGLESRGMCIL